MPEFDLAKLSSTLTKNLVEGSTIARIDRRYWGVAASRPSELSTLYTLGIIDLTTFRGYYVPNSDPARKVRGSDYYQFPTPPSSYEVAEDAATTIVPTQNGGKFVESQGGVTKEIRINGTVGFRPKPVANKLDSSMILNPAPQAVNLVSSTASSAVPGLFSDDRGLDRKEITALDDITFLRNIIRGYWDLKRVSDDGRKYAMVWTYRKESEQYVVEPLSFSSSRSSSNPLSWNYSIILRTLFRTDDLFERVEDPLDVFDVAKGIWQGINQVKRALITASANLENLFDSYLRLYEVGRSLANLPGYIGTQFAQNINRIINKIERIETVGLRGATHKGEFELLKENAQLIKESAYKAMNASVSGPWYDAFGKNYSLTPSDDAAEDNHRDAIRRGAVLTERACNTALTISELFETSKSVTVKDYAAPYNQFGQTPVSSGTPLDPNNIRIPQSGKEVTVEKNDTLRSIARRYMGDESFWKLLAILNNLRFPYVSQVAGDGVIAYGDKLLIPKDIDARDNQGTNQIKPTDEDKETSPYILRYYGRDVKLSKGSQGTDLADVEVGQNGDLALIDGIDNVDQSIMIKFSTEQGELPTHPKFGATYPVGSKISLGLLHEFMINTKRTIFQDPRVQDVEDLRVFAQGDVVHVQGKAKLKHSDVRLPVNFAVRS